MFSLVRSWRWKNCSMSRCLLKLVELEESSSLLFFDILFVCLKFSFIRRRLGVGGPLKDFLENIGKTLPEGPGVSAPSLASVGGVEVKWL